MKKLSLSLLLLCGACAFNSTIDQAAPGIYTIKSVEGAGGGNLNALEWEINHQAAEICPKGFEQLSQRKLQDENGRVFITTIKCGEVSRGE